MRIRPYRDADWAAVRDICDLAKPDEMQGVVVDDLDAALARVEALDAKREQVFGHAAHRSAAFCSDLFGHGFCRLQRARNQ